MIDCHAHYDHPKFDPDREELLKSLFSAGIKGIINAGTDKATSLFSHALSERFPNMYFTAGVHPEYAPACGDFETWLAPLLQMEKCVAIGEIGLDYHYDTPKAPQKEVFYRQLAMAVRYDKPVVIHNREAHEDCIAAVGEFPGLKGVFHSYSGSAKDAESLAQRGFYISFSGVVTFHNAKETARAAFAVPVEKLLAETDCPYLTPHPHRGKRCDSGFMKWTVQKLADIKGLSFDAMEKALSENARRIFAIK